MRHSLSAKLNHICKNGRIEQLHLSQLDPITQKYFIGYLAQDYLVFKYTPFNDDGKLEGAFTQAVMNAADFIKNVYSFYKG